MKINKVFGSVSTRGSTAESLLQTRVGCDRNALELLALQILLHLGSLLHARHERLQQWEGVQQLRRPSHVVDDQVVDAVISHGNLEEKIYRYTKINQAF